MYYIVIDLEWNQCPQGRNLQEKSLPFEIIEIGAVKLDKNREVIDEFSELICPQVYQEMHTKTQEIVHIDMETLHRGSTFTEVAKKLFEFCGRDFIFCTWGSMDLTELQRNLDYYGLTEYIKEPIKYYDVQKLFSLCFEDKKSIRTLSYAIEFLNIDCREIFHRAFIDAKYTAKIFELLRMDMVKKYYSIDYYQNPKSKEDEIYLVYDNYSKYITREFNSKEEAFQSKDVKDVYCYQCQKKAAKRMRWFSSNAKTYYCLCYCKEHGYLKGKISVKKSKTGKSFVVKIVKSVEQEAIRKLEIKLEEVMRKKRKKK